MAGQTGINRETGSKIQRGQQRRQRRSGLIFCLFLVCRPRLYRRGGGECAVGNSS